MIDVNAIHAATTPLAAAQALGFEVASGARPERCRIRHHGERNPSCDVARRDGRIVYTCRSCGVGGDIVALAAEQWGLSPRHDFRTIAVQLGELFGVTVETASAAPVTAPRRDPAVDLAMRIDGMAADWLCGRGIRDADASVVEAAGLDGACEALELLREADEDEDARTDAALDRLAPRILAEIAEREARWLAELAAEEAAS